MKATTVNDLLLAAAVLIAFALSSGSGSIAAADGDAPHIGEGGLPQFEVDREWPQIPRQFRIGPGSAVHGDDRGSIWILSRPKVAAALPEMKDTTRKPAPPVMEFDQSGNLSLLITPIRSLKGVCDTVRVLGGLHPESRNESWFQGLLRA